MSLYTAFMLWSSSVQDLGSDILTKVWIVLTIAAGWTVDYLTTYYNNDYTEEACIGTGLTRQLKAEGKDGYGGDIFFSEDEEVGDEDE